MSLYQAQASCEMLRPRRSPKGGVCPGNALHARGSHQPPTTLLLLGRENFHGGLCLRGVPRQCPIGMGIRRSRHDPAPSFITAVRQTAEVGGGGLHPAPALSFLLACRRGGQPGGGWGDFRDPRRPSSAVQRPSDATTVPSVSEGGGVSLMHSARGPIVHHRVVYKK